MSFIPHALPNFTFLKNQTYQVIEPIASGGFGIIYKALNGKTNQYIAIKELFINTNAQTMCLRKGEKNVIPNYNSQLFEHHKQKFKGEYNFLLSFRGDEGIIQVSDFFEENQTMYIVMDLSENGMLKDYILSNNDFLDENFIKNTTIKILEALKKIHNKNIIHRDLKPSNILLDKNKNPVLIDFGVAKEAENELANIHTAINSEGFSAPELINKKIKCGNFTDIYAVGATLFQMITKQNTPNPGTIKVKPECVNVLRYRPNLSNKFLVDAVKIAMSLSGSQRFQSCDEMLDFLAEKPDWKKSTTSKPIPQNKPKTKNTISTFGFVFYMLLGMLLPLGVGATWFFYDDIKAKIEELTEKKSEITIPKRKIKILRMKFDPQNTHFEKNTLQQIQEQITDLPFEECLENEKAKFVIEGKVQDGILSNPSLKTQNITQTGKKEIHIIFLNENAPVQMHNTPTNTNVKIMMELSGE